MASSGEDVRAAAAPGQGLRAAESRGEVVLVPAAAAASSEDGAIMLLEDGRLPLHGALPIPTARRVPPLGVLLR